MSPITREPGTSGARNLLSTYREKLNLSQDAFASVAGLTPSEVAQLERGETLQYGGVVLSRYLQGLAAEVLAQRLWKRPTGNLNR